MKGSMLPSSARSLRPIEANSPSAHSLTPGRCEARTPGENTCALVMFSMTISTVLVPVPNAGSLYCAWAIDEIVRNATAAGVNLTKRIMLPSSYSPILVETCVRQRPVRRNAPRNFDCVGGYCNPMLTSSELTFHTASNDGHILAEREQVGNIKRPLTHCFLSSRSTIHSQVELRLLISQAIQS